MKSLDGRSTILAGLTGRAVRPAGAATIDEAIVPVPDERFEWLAPYCNPKKTTYATIDCLDLPGFNFTDDHGRAAARRLIGQIRTVDLLVLVEEVEALGLKLVVPREGAVGLVALDRDELPTLVEEVLGEPGRGHRLPDAALGLQDAVKLLHL